MGRYVLVNHGGQEYVLPESMLPSEARLHDALEKHPELFPAEDLNLGQLLVVGREVPFESGMADLLYLDESGQIVIVEVKKGTENPDSRRVVAQLLDYGAHLWGMSYEDFESRIALPYLRQRRGQGNAPSSLIEAAAASFAFDEETSSEQFRLSLTAHLAAGTFVYVVAARTLSPTLGTVLRYLAAISTIQTAAITVDYYRDEDRDIMVPRVAFSSAEQTPPPADPPTKKTTPERFLTEVHGAVGFWTECIASLQGLPGRFYWGTKGFSYRILIDGKQYPVIWGYPRTVWWLKDRGCDTLEVLVEASPSRPERVRVAVSSIEDRLRGLPNAHFKRAGDNLSALVAFEVRDSNPPEWQAGLQSALAAMFEVAAEA